MKINEYINVYKPKINEAIKIIYDRKLKSVKNPFLRTYYTELRKYFLAGGKRIRPLLCIATYNSLIDTPDEDIVIPSVGTEFLHNASLIHDDIIDKDDFRRGKPAFHYRFKKLHSNYDLKKMLAEDFGTNIGIIGGDSAFFMGLEAFLINNFDHNLNFKAIQYYEQAFIEISDGVLIEIDMVNQKKLQIQDYINMISLKTGALIEKSILIGANYAKAEEKYKKLLSTYGLNLGIIFQIIDDILGTFGDEKVTGKPTDGDIREGKKTCLLIEANNKLDDHNRKLLEQLIGKPEMSDDDVLKVKELFEKAGVIESSKELANSYFLEAKSVLDDLGSIINESEAEFFESLLKFVAERKF
ncbi:MAG: polyprenyl synthetase family protein [Promethearchaeota archaeon]|nr:MAG: polyprenyl synthetase family protein [Candidatus Lokiarchaeota archaeon]